MLSPGELLKFDESSAEKDVVAQLLVHIPDPTWVACKAVHSSEDPKEDPKRDIALGPHH